MSVPANTFAVYEAQHTEAARRAAVRAAIIARTRAVEERLMLERALRSLEISAPMEGDP